MPITRAEARIDGLSSRCAPPVHFLQDRSFLLACFSQFFLNVPMPPKNLS